MTKRKKFKRCYSKNKNTETNISNQIFSFICSDKSQSIIKKIFREDLEKVEEFYKIMKKIKKNTKKYLNREEIIDLIRFDSTSRYIKVYKKSHWRLEIEEIKKVLRIAVNFFLCNLCV